MNASRTNRELWQHFVAAEVDKTAAHGSASLRADEVEALRVRSPACGHNSRKHGASGESAPTRKAATNRAPAKKAAAP